jgi:hypothetical protein
LTKHGYNGGALNANPKNFSILLDQEVGMWPDAGKAFDWSGELPLFQRVRQEFPRDPVTDIAAAVRQSISNLGELPFALPGKRIAITAGSRGISSIAEILAATVAALRDRGAEPFIIPAMGRPGGGTAEGQVAMLAELGVTEETAGAPI